MRSSRPCLDFAIGEVSGHDALGMTIHGNQVEHLLAGVHLDLTGCNLPAQGTVCPDQELLSGLPTGIKSPADLRSAKGSVCQKAPVFTSKGNSLGHALVYDVDAHLSEAMYVGLSGTEVTPLDRVIEKTVDAVTVVLVVFGRVYASLGRYGMSSAGGVLVTKAVNVIAQFAQRCRGRPTGKPRTNDDNPVLSLVRGVDQLRGKAMVVPLLGDGPIGYL